MRNILCKFFINEGAKVFSAGSGKKALEMALQLRIDLVISDVKMPVMDGPELLKIIKINRDIVPVFWFMAEQGELNKDNLLDIGADGVLVRPFKFLIALEQIVLSIEKRDKNYKCC